MASVNDILEVVLQIVILHSSEYFGNTSKKSKWSLHRIVCLVIDFEHIKNHKQPSLGIISSRRSLANFSKTLMDGAKNLKSSSEKTFGTLSAPHVLVTLSLDKLSPIDSTEKDIFDTILFCDLEVRGNGSTGSCFQCRHSQIK